MIKKSFFSVFCILTIGACASMQTTKFNEAQLKPFSNQHGSRAPASRVNLQSIMVNEITQSSIFSVNRDVPALDIQGRFGSKEKLESQENDNIKYFEKSRGTSAEVGARPFPFYLKNRACEIYHGNQFAIGINVPKPLLKGWKFDVLKAGVNDEGELVITLGKKLAVWDVSGVFGSSRLDPVLLEVRCNNRQIVDDSTLQELSVALEDIFTIKP